MFLLSSTSVDAGAIMGAIVGDCYGTSVNACAIYGRKYKSAVNFWKVLKHFENWPLFIKVYAIQISNNLIFLQTYFPLNITIVYF